MKHKEYFNSIAEKWDDMVEHNKQKLNILFKHINIEKGESVLDVGTGTGVLIPYIHNFVGNNGEIYAIDLSEKMIEIAKKKYDFKNVKYFQGDVNKLNMENDFNSILCYSVFPHFPKKEDTINNLAKGLKRNGKLVIFHSQSREKINSIHKNIGGTVANDLLPPVDEIANMMMRAGLDVEKQIDNSDMFFIKGIKR
ncbi:class I SAM-dependent methyltransferase [Thermohalobacter berrensis]|uniref:Methyltransferase domain-containing protein n=1 Tax=Thermohalobacter berrensis TaxID=99594 RepID=A0A419T8K5_9FIRM|nr:class I SAM-dependent methyltransferase [Thermohalobacter berrensis]RKD33789.1 hypothetical protein BET03_08685 [Thermohalobacter berrensis]